VKTVEFTVRGQFVNMTNAHEVPMQRHRRVQRERASTSACLLRQCGPNWRQGLGPPYTVTFTRVGKKVMDDDGVVAACKAIRDQVAFELSLGDSPSDPITWKYRQERGEYCVRVRVEATEMHSGSEAPL
jgi:hypothetical protein